MSGLDSEQREIRGKGSVEKDDRKIRMMMIDENNDVNDADGMNVSHGSEGQRREGRTW
jgi:hypothetical protein